MPVQRSPIKTRSFSLINETPLRVLDINSSILDNIVSSEEELQVTSSGVQTETLIPLQIPTNMAANIYLALIPNYNVDSNDFIIKSDHIYSKMVTADDRALFLTHILMKFSGPILQTISNIEPLTWEAIKASLNQSVEKPQDSRDLFSELSKTSQGQNEDIIDYGGRILKVFNKLNVAYLNELKENGENIVELPVNIKKLNEKTCMRAFEDGIHSPNLKMITILEKVETLTASISFASMQEKRFGISPKFPNSQTQSSNTFTPTCHRCGVVGHLSPQCPTHQRPISSTCTFCHKIGHLVENCRIRIGQNGKSEMKENEHRPYENPFSRSNFENNQMSTNTNRINFTDFENTSPKNTLSREEELNITSRVSNLQ